MTVTVLSQHARRYLDGRLPEWLEPRWFGNADELKALLPEAEIGWFDGVGLDTMLDAPHDVGACR